jgi:hypothetical protein
MIIAVAGPYSASSEEERQQNLSRLNESAARLLEVGQVPLIGVNAALPVVEKANAEMNPYDAIMKISMAVVNCCDAILVIGESPGANQERDLFLAKALPVYYSLNEVPGTL